MCSPGFQRPEGRAPASFGSEDVTGTLGHVNSLLRAIHFMNTEGGMGADLPKLRNCHQEIYLKGMVEEFPHGERNERQKHGTSERKRRALEWAKTAIDIQQKYK